MNLDIAAFQTELNSRLDIFLQEEFLAYQAISKHSDVLSHLKHIQAVSHGGKRLRPLLVWSLYQHNNPSATPDSIMPLLLAVELFHIFCLIHDDIMDEALTRHGVPTIHAHAKQNFYKPTLTGAAKIADNQAILAGDIVFNSVFKLLHTFAATHQKTSHEVLSVFHTLVDEVCIGQMIDVHLTAQTKATDEEIIEKNKLKTAYYSFARPLHLGVVVSGRTSLLPCALSFGEKLGILYQIQDDLLDIIGDPAVTKKPPFQDVIQNQHTLISNFVRASSPKASHILDSFSGKTLSEDDITTLKELFISTGAIAYTDTIIDTTISEISDLLETHGLADDDKELFMTLVSLILKRTS